MLARRARSFFTVALALALPAAGCSKSEGAAEGASDPAPAEADASPADDAKESVPEQTPPKVQKPSGIGITPDGKGGPGTVADTIAAMVDADPGYPIEVDPLLDLVAADADIYFVIRDVDDLFSITDAMMGPVEAPLQKLASKLAAAGQAGAPAEVDQAYDRYAKVREGIRSPRFDLSKGMVITSLETTEDVVVIHGGTDPKALPDLLTSMGSDAAAKMTCAPVTQAAGYIACAKGSELLAKYAPAKTAAKFRAALSKRMPGHPIDTANVLMWLDDDPNAAVAIATPPGLFHATMGVSPAPSPDVMRYMAKGDSPGLAMVAPGSAFYWANVNMTEAKAETKDQNFFVKNVVGSMSGEFLFGSLVGTDALFLVAGLEDPGPAEGLIALALTQLDKIPKTLPDGTSIEAASETLEIAGKSVQTLHMTMKPTATNAEMFRKMGLVPEAWLFAAGGYGGAVFGGGKEAVTMIGTHAGGGLAADLAQQLPKPMAKGLVDGELAFSMHLPFDSLQSPSVTEAFDAAAKTLPTDDLPAGLTPAMIMDMTRAFAAPVSGLSMWMPTPKDAMVFHFAATLPADSRTEEGKAVRAVIDAVNGGADSSSAYRELAARFSSSARVLSYQARSGERRDGALSSVAVIGVLAAIAVPAVAKYVERSKAAGAAVDPPPGG
ncbi:MAG: hypothetical protein K0V04_11215 [Deltaproteobacteria bacterium]|nr:hypothetical protein [Deltaproteobacteria bacterium]